MVINNHLSQLLSLRDARFRRTRTTILQICRRENNKLSDFNQSISSIRSIKPGVMETKRLGATEKL